MVKAKKRKTKKKKMLRQSKLPPNETYWFSVSEKPEEIKAFAERGNERQKKYLQAIINYRLWQIQEGKIDKNFFGDLDVKKLDLNTTTVKDKVKKKVVKKKSTKPIDLFDMNNIEDLTKEDV